MASAIKMRAEWLWHCWHWLPSCGPFYAPDGDGNCTIPCPGEWEFNWLGFHLMRIDCG